MEANDGNNEGDDEDNDDDDNDDDTDDVKYADDDDLDYDNWIHDSYLDKARMLTVNQRSYTPR